MFFFSQIIFVFIYRLNNDKKKQKIIKEEFLALFFLIKSEVEAMRINCSYIKISKKVEK